MRFRGLKWKTTQMVIVKVCFQSVPFVTLITESHGPHRKPLPTVSAGSSDPRPHGNVGTAVQDVPGPAASEWPCCAFLSRLGGNGPALIGPILPLMFDPHAGRTVFGLLQRGPVAGRLILTWLSEESLREPRRLQNLERTFTGMALVRSGVRRMNLHFNTPPG